MTTAIDSARTGAAARSLQNILPPVRRSLLMAIAIGAIACDSGASRMPAVTLPDPSGAKAFSDVFRIVRHIELEERQEVINVTPIAHVEPDGDLLVVDSREAQLRWYGPTGGLRATFGRKGLGPGEFQVPVSFRRLEDGRFYVVDAIGGGISFIDPGMTNYVDGARIPLMPLYGVLPVDSTHLLLLGREQGGAQRPRLLHEWSLSSRSIERSFFELPTHDALAAPALALGFVAAATKGDTIAAVFSISDTVFLFLPGQRSPIERIPIPISRFSVTSPSPEAIASERARNEWLQTVTVIGGLHWLGDGSFIVQWATKGKVDDEFGLIRITRAGKKVFELHDSPQLFAVAGDHFYLANPESEVPSQWIVAELIEP